MPKFLTQAQVDQYHGAGYCAPIDVMPEQDALELAERLEQAERDYPGALEGRNRNNSHLVLQCIDDIAFHPVILDIVEDLIGGDFLLYGTVLFIKEPESRGYVSWHQDATYMGIAPHNFVTPWLALSPSNSENGCMSVIPGSHGQQIHEHQDTFDEDNILTRGQQIEGVDESQAVDIVLRPGQASCHHARLIHGSRPNRSNRRRIGVALQCYFNPQARQTLGHGQAILARGEDRFGNFELLPRPQGEMQPESIRVRDQVNDNWTEILYAGADKTRNY